MNQIDQRLYNVERDSKLAEDELEQILKTKKQIVRNKLTYQASNDRFNQLFDKLSERNDELDMQSASVEEIRSTILDQQESIQNIIDDANRASMAGSFKKRKDELDKPIKSSWWIMIGALICTAGVSAYLLVNSGLFMGEFNYQEFLMKIPVVAPLVWIAWSSSQRNNYLVRIQEDYAFKYASAMAFEGYRKQVQEVDADLEKRLLELSVENMGMNPIRLFDKAVKCSPINDVVHSMSDATKSIKNTISAQKDN
ncbi:hypothetical protein [Vibrio chagasii]|uniref:hypothetical protein n=1 Tax=Vibrio chagasii TaxID=170679 RepID=UPI003DA15784